MDEELEFTLQPTSDKFDEDSDAWNRQVADLMGNLREFSLRRTQATVPGTRGGAVEIILALGSAGAFTAAVTVVRAWLERDKSRRIYLRYKRKAIDLEFSADSISDEALKLIVSEFTS